MKICGLSQLGGKINWDSKRVKWDVLEFGIVLWELLTGEVSKKMKLSVLSILTLPLIFFFILSQLSPSNL